MKTTTNSLSSLLPIRLSYNFNSDEELSCEYRTIQGGLNYFKHQLFESFQDAAFSNKTALFLTSSKKLKSVFKNTSHELSVGDIPNCFSLSVSNTNALMGDTQIKTLNKSLFVGGKGESVFFNAIPVERGIVQLRFKNMRVAVEKHYPYTVYLTSEPVPDDEKERELFQVEFVNNRLTLKNKTKEGYRYLSYSKDRKVRCVGLELNDAIINEYYFFPNFPTSSTLKYNFDPTNYEVKYFNETDSPIDDKTVFIKEKQELDVNLLVDCPLKTLVESTSSAPVNIALIKTNFTPKGVFNNSL